MCGYMLVGVLVYDGCMDVRCWLDGHRLVVVLAYYVCFVDIR